MTPGTHPASVSSVTITIEPHPRSRTASGGNSTHRITRPQPTVTPLNYLQVFFSEASACLAFSASGDFLLNSMTYW